MGREHISELYFLGALTRGTNVAVRQFACYELWVWALGWKLKQISNFNSQQLQSGAWLLVNSCNRMQ